MVYVAFSTDSVVQRVNEAIQGPRVELVLHGGFVIDLCLSLHFSAHVISNLLIRHL